MKAAHILILLMFLAISIISTWASIADEGYFIYRDEGPLFSSDSFKEYFLHINKNDNYADIDFQKRIPLFSILLLIPGEIYEMLRFPAIAFLTLTVSFYVAKRILAKERMGERERLLISASAAFAYLINPFSLELFLSSLPMINYALFPLFFLLLHEGFTKPSPRSVLLSSVIAAFMFLLVVHSILYIGISFMVLLPVLLRLRPGSLVRNLLLFGAVFFFCTSFILIPYFASNRISETPQGVFSASIVSLDSFSFVSALPKAMLMDLHTWWWPYVHYIYPTGDMFFLLSFLFSSALFLHAFFDRSDWSVMALLGLVILFFMSKGNLAPFPGIYEFLNFEMVMGWLLRVPGKFLHIIPFFFFLLLLRLSSSLAKVRWALPAFLALYLVFLSLSSWPFFTGDFAGVLEKTDLSSYEGDLSSINGLFADDRPSILTDAFIWPQLISTDITNGGIFIDRELEAYARFSDWSGLRIAPFLGFQYLITPSNAEAETGFPVAYEGTRFTVHRLKEDPAVFTASGEGYLCYCGLDTARSLVRDPPGGDLPEVLAFPYQVTDFPQDVIGASQYAVFDSQPPPSPSFESARVFPLNSHQLASRRNISSLGHWDFQEGFTILSKEPVHTSYRSSERALVLEDLDIVTGDFVKGEDGSYVLAKDNRSLWTSISSELDIWGPAIYEMHLAIEGDSLRRLNVDMVMQDQHNRIGKSVSVLDAAGSFQENASIQFSVPSNTSRVTLLISARLSDESESSLNITNLTIDRKIYDTDGERVSSSFTVPKDGEFDLHLRLKKSPEGGKLHAYLDDGQPILLDTKSRQSGFFWEKVYSGYLSAGMHEMTVQQVAGSNAINVGYLGDSGGAGLSDKTIIYRLVGINDFYGQGTWAVESNSSSTFRYLASREPMFSRFEVLIPGTYSISSSTEGSARILVDGQEAGAEAYLVEGNHTIEVRPLGQEGVFLDHVTLVREVSAPVHGAEILEQTRTDPSSYTLLVNSTGPYFLTFGRGYNPDWVAWVDGVEHRPISSYASVNTYYIDRTGMYEVFVGYQSQKWLYIGAGIGMIGLIAAVMCVRRWERC